MCMPVSTEIVVPVELSHPKNDRNALGPFPSIFSLSLITQLPGP